MYRFCANRLEFINFVETGGICNTHHWLKGMDAPGHANCFFNDRSDWNEFLTRFLLSTTPVDVRPIRGVRRSLTAAVIVSVLIYVKSTHIARCYNLLVGIYDRKGRARGRSDFWPSRRGMACLNPPLTPMSPPLPSFSPYLPQFFVMTSSSSALVCVRHSALSVALLRHLFPSVLASLLDSPLQL